MPDFPIYPINPAKPLLRWGPVPGRFFYMSEFNEACFERFPKMFPGLGIPTALLFFHQGRFLWLQQLEPFQTACKKIFRAGVLPDAPRQNLYATWKRAVARLEEVQTSIATTDLAQLSDEAFEKLWCDFYEHVIQFWIPTIPPEFGNYGSDQLLMEALRPFVPPEKLAGVMEILTAPETASFYQEEEIDLAETNDLEAHTQKYFWLKNSYAGTQILSRSFFEERKKEVVQDIRARHEAHLREVRQKKQEVIGRYHISDEVLGIANALRIAIEWQDERKKYIFQTLHYKDMLLRHLALRYGYEYETLLNYDFQEIASFTFFRRNKDTYKIRNIGCSVLHVLQSTGEYAMAIQNLSQDEIAHAWNMYLVEQGVEAITDFKGTIACVGAGEVIRGRVKVLLDPNQSKGFKSGDILVAPMTSPEYIFVMKIASAILTDTGGLTSHAAIVSRELHVPCLVGTKVATHVLKDGDEIEVDPKAGTVKILKRV